MIEFYRPVECQTCGEFEDALKEMVIAHRVVTVKAKQLPDSLPAETHLPAIKDDEKIIMGEAEIKVYLEELKKVVADWRKFQGDACYIDEDGQVC